MVAAPATWHNPLVRTFAVILALCGCGPSLPDVVAGHEVAQAGGAPSISSIVDLGGRATRSPGALGGVAPSDAVAAIGELVLLRGADLGRLPRVSVGGLPATIEAHTTDGLIVRVPPGVAPGEQSFVVEHSHGVAGRRFPIRRWALVVAENAVYPIAVDSAGLRALPPLSAPGAREVRFAADGSVAYVLGVKLHVIDVVAPGGPQAVTTRELPAAADHLVVARDRGAARAALVSGSTLVMIDVSSPYQPAFWSARPIHKDDAGAAAAADMDDTGKRLALLFGNRASFFDVADVKNPIQAQSVDLLPGVRPPLGTHLRFASDGALWVLAGDNPRSLATGSQPLRLLRVKGGVVDAGRTMDDAGAPAGLALAPESRRVRGSTIHASAMAPVLVAAGGGTRGGGAVHRVDGETVESALDTPEALIAMDAAPGAVLAIACRDGRVVVHAAGGAAVKLAASCTGTQAIAVQP